MKGSNFMSKETLEFIQEKAKELIAAPSCSAEAKEAAQAWLAAVGTDKQAEETKKFIAEMEEDIIPIDGLIAFAESDAGAKVFGGAEKAKGVAEHGKEIKAAGAKYCDCPACAAVEAILSKKDELLAQGNCYTVRAEKINSVLKKIQMLQAGNRSRQCLYLF